MSGGKESKLDWMYAGPSSSIDREQYLTGKKIDKNFEKLHSEFREPQSALENVVQNKTLAGAPSSTSQFVGTMLDVETIRKEDPLVAIRVREEVMLREILENPIKRKRLRKIVVRILEKRWKRQLQEEKTLSASVSKDRRSHRRSSGSDSDEDEQPRKRSRRSEERRSSPDRETRRSFHAAKNSPVRQKNIVDDKPVRANGGRHDSPFSSSSEKSLRSADSSDSDDNRKRRKQLPKYGLVHMKERKEPHRSNNDRSSPDDFHRFSARSSLKRKDIMAKQSNEQTRRGPVSNAGLSQKEMEKKLQEMSENAKWRDDQRRHNADRLAREAEEEKKRDSRRSGTSSGFVRSLLSEASREDTLEKRVQSRRQGIQRRETAMETNFARK